MAIPGILKQMLNLPTTTFRETAVKAYVLQFCAKLKYVSVSEDRYGNILVTYCYKPPRVSPVVFTAHMDHPGFVAVEMVEKKLLRAAFRGGVRAEFFTNARVKFYADGGCVNARVSEITRAREVSRGGTSWRVPEEALLRVARAVAPGTVGMWDLPGPVEKSGNVYARDCDDIAGCAAMLAMLERLSRKRAAAETYCLFTRAEEVGFIGAIGAARARTIDKRMPVIAIETSSELPHARIGDGPILRVGDRMSVFDPSATAFCERVAKKLAARKKAFKYQRKLMDGGACESTAYLAYGYRATGICLALGNYHNMDVMRGRTAPEYVSLNDWKLMVDWFEALALDAEGFKSAAGAARADMERSFEKWKKYF